SAGHTSGVLLRGQPARLSHIPAVAGWLAGGFGRGQGQDKPQKTRTTRKMNRFPVGRAERRRKKAHEGAADGGAKCGRFRGVALLRGSESRQVLATGDYSAWLPEGGFLGM